MLSKFLKIFSIPDLRKKVFFVLFLFLLSSLASSDSKNITISKEAQELEKQLRQAEKDMQEMQE